MDTYLISADREGHLLPLGTVLAGEEEKDGAVFKRFFADADELLAGRYDAKRHTYDGHRLVRTPVVPPGATGDGASFA